MRGKTVIVSILLIAVLLAAFSFPGYASDTVGTSDSQWIVGEEYGGRVLFHEDGSISVLGNSGIVTYVGEKLMDCTVTVKFKASVPSEDGWGAIYICNNVDTQLLRSLDDGGGIRAFPWYGQGFPLSVNIKNNRVSLTNSYIEGLRSVNTMTEHGKYRFQDPQVEHTLEIRTEQMDELTVQFDITVDNDDTLHYTQRSSGELPMKEAGYLSFACCKSSEWLQILSVKIDDRQILPLTLEERKLVQVNSSETTAPESTKPDLPETTGPVQPPVADIAGNGTQGFPFLPIVAAMAAAVLIIWLLVRKKGCRA